MIWLTAGSSMIYVSTGHHIAKVERTRLPVNHVSTAHRSANAQAGRPLEIRVGHGIVNAYDNGLIAPDMA